ncbi:MAG TPA: N(G),N(G)-dimethylarginine dimethylaminohydrolase [Solirubrobacteraceae bacterium]|nr:N(G),N(G)-dimethylarginine dimethylaminohydrolase [Solirubrobacteraceae bacterium]
MSDRIAMVRRPSRRMADGIVTHIDRTPVDVELAFEQHARYVRALASAGWAIHEVEPADELPDSAFIEDAVVTCDGLAVLTRPGVPERLAEVAGAETAAQELGLEIARIEAPGTLDGGDVLQVGTTVYVGRGGRTNGEGIRQLRRHLATRDRTVVPVPLKEVLHLKSAITALPDGTIIANDPALIDASALPTLRAVPEEGGSHVVLLGGGSVLMAASAPRSAELFDDLGFDPEVVDISEFEKMEGCVTCLSVLVVRT